MRFSVLLLAAGAEAEHNLSIFAPVSPSAEAIRGLAILVLAITGAILVVVEVALFYSVFRFRRAGPKSKTEPPQVYGSQPIEIAWTVAPCMIVFVLGLVVARTEWEVRTVPPAPREGDNTLFVTAIGHQWWWEFRYDHFNGRPLGFATANELHVPAGETTGDVGQRPVHLTLLSADVCHSFWAPRLAGKTDLIPGKPNHMWFATAETGLYLGQCAEFCGTQHANMLLRVVVEPVDAFETWLANEAKEASPPPADDTQAVAGQQVFLGQSCVNCHRVRGTPAAGAYAPELTHLMSRQTLASCEVDNTYNNLRAWLVDPQKLKPGCLMPAFGLSDTEVDQVTAYLRTLK